MGFTRDSQVSSVLGLTFKDYLLFFYTTHMPLVKKRVRLIKKDATDDVVKHTSVDTDPSTPSEENAEEADCVSDTGSIVSQVDRHDARHLDLIRNGVDPLDEQLSLMPAAKKSVKKPVKKTADKKTRGPGRPPKKDPNPPLKRSGIRQAPTTQENVIEFMYGFPIWLKRVMAFFKSLATINIQIIFRPTEVILYGRDHNKHSHVRVRLDGSKLHCYHCQGTYKMTFVRRELELILNKVDKDYRNIIIIAAQSHVKKYVTMTFDNGMDIDEEHRIDIREGSQDDNMQNEQAFLDEDAYTLSFRFPCKYFKKTIGDIRPMSQSLAFVQDAVGEPLGITYRTVNKKVRSRHTCRDPKNTINFCSKLSGDDSFRVDVNINHIKPISQAQFADHVYIYVDENKPLMTRTVIDDGAIEIKTLTDIIDKRGKSNTF